MLSKFRSILLPLIFILMSGCAKRPPAAPTVFYPSLPAEPRLQFLKSYSKAEDVLKAPGAVSSFILGDKEEKIEFVKPYGVAARNGRIYVCDTKRMCVHVLNPGAHQYEVMGRNILKKPINIAFDESGRSYVADTSLKQILVFDAEGRYLKSLGDPLMIRPTDVAVSGDELYVCDIRNHVIRVWNRETGEELRTVGEAGSQEGELFHPTNIVVDKEGYLYVSDTGNFRVQKFDDQGNHFFTYGGIGFSLGKFARPKGIALDDQGRLYVVDSGFENIQIFDQEGRLLLFFGEPGNQPGQINLPAKVTVSRELTDYYQQFAEAGFELEYLVFVTSQYGLNKVNIYGFGRYVPASEQEME